MKIENQRQLENTQVKLELTLKQYEEAKKRPIENPRVRELTLRSLKQTINQLKEEIAVYRAHAHVGTGE